MLHRIVMSDLHAKAQNPLSKHYSFPYRGSKPIKVLIKYATKSLTLNLIKHV